MGDRLTRNTNERSVICAHGIIAVDSVDGDVITELETDEMMGWCYQ